MSEVKNSLLDFSKKYVAAYEQAQLPLTVVLDAYGTSSCITRCAAGTASWLPTQQDVTLDFGHLERGLNLAVHRDFQDYFCCLWSDHLHASAERGELQLLMVWNQDDFIRLQENLIGHVLMKRRLGQQETLFFAQTEDENFILSILNHSGEVVLEPVGQEPTEALSDNLATFIASLQPITKPPQDAWVY